MAIAWNNELEFQKLFKHHFILWRKFKCQTSFDKTSLTKYDINDRCPTELQNFNSF